jgi:hypothetical protein
MLLQIHDLRHLPSYNVDDIPLANAREITWNEEGSVKLNHSAALSTQCFLLIKRELLNLKRDTGALFGRFFVTTLLQILFSFIFFQVGDTSKADYDFNSHFGAIINMFVTGLFVAIQPPLLTFALERVVFLREV